MARRQSPQLPVQQRAWDTRTRILSAAVECLVKDGYAATTVSRIQARSGVSRGSVNHQFPSMNELLVAAVQHLAVVRTADMVAQGARAADDPDHAVVTLWAAMRGPLFTATVELWIAARNSEDLRRELGPREHELGHNIRSAVARIFGPSLSAAPRFPELVSLLLTSMRGVALTYMFEPRDPAHDPHIVVWQNLARIYLVESAS